MGLLITAGIILYLLVCWFLWCMCRAAATFERFYEGMTYEPRNDESPAQGEASIGEQASSLEFTAGPDR